MSLGCQGFHHGLRVVGRKCEGKAGPMGKEAKAFWGCGRKSAAVWFRERSMMGVSAWMLKMDCGGDARGGVGAGGGGASSPWSHHGMVARCVASVVVPGMAKNPAVK